MKPGVAVEERSLLRNGLGGGGSLASETLRVLLVRLEHLWTCGKGMGVRRVQAQSA